MQIPLLFADMYPDTKLHRHITLSILIPDIPIFIAIKHPAELESFIK